VKSLNKVKLKNSSLWQTVSEIHISGFSWFSISSLNSHVIDCKVILEFYQQLFKGILTLFQSQMSMGQTGLEIS